MALAALLLGNVAAAQPASIDEFFEQFATDWVRHDPNLATSTRYLSGEEQNRLERQLTPQTRAWRLDRIQRAKNGLVPLRQFDRSKMTDVQRISTDLMQWQLQTIVDEEPYLDYTFPLEQFQGANVNLVNGLIISHPLVTARDAENYVAALGELSTRVQEATEEARRLAEKGMIPPRFILQATIKQMESFTDSAPAQNPLVTVLSQKMQAIQSMSEASRNDFRGRAEGLVRSEVYPAYKSAIALLRGQLGRSSDDAGIWRLKGGTDAYGYFLRRFTTTDLTPDQIHELGLRQVQTIEQQMDGILKRLGRTQGTVKERIEKLQAALTYPNPTSEESREQIMRDIEGILRDAQQRAAGLFDKVPKAAVIAQPYPKFQEANNAARFVPPSPDGARPGILLFPRRLEWMTKFQLRSLVYHEGVPGHFYQAGLEIENPALPRFRRLRALLGISAYGEGWGLYAEHLAADSGWYDGDPEGLLGQLNSELFRARRLVTDTGIHVKHWTRQQAIDYGIEPSEVERYVVNPGQACSYMIGELKILELREKAKKALGPEFSGRDFHNVVLGTGTVPLKMLEQEVNAYIRSNGGKI
jgi:uncharacterized protein (DUF885 family)